MICQSTEKTHSLGTNLVVAEALRGVVIYLSKAPRHSILILILTDDGEMRTNSR